jgi:hypothetical protein
MKSDKKKLEMNDDWERGREARGTRNEERERGTKKSKKEEDAD